MLTTKAERFICHKITLIVVIVTITGLLVMNLVCRDQLLRNSVVSTLKEIFKRAFVRKVPEEVNEIVFALPTSRKTDLALKEDDKLPDELAKNLRTLQTVVRTNSANSGEVPALAYKLTNLKLL